MKIILPKNAKQESVFTAEVDLDAVADETSWTAEELEFAVRIECGYAGINPGQIDVGFDNNGIATFATVSVF